MATEQQRREALLLANKIRIDRSKFKKDLKAGAIQVQDAILNPPDCIVKMPIETLLLTLPGFGHGRVARTLRQAKVSLGKQIGSLSDRQRAALIWSIQRQKPKTSPRR